MIQEQKLVRDWMIDAEQVVKDSPVPPTRELASFRSRLIWEELNELDAALGLKNEPYDVVEATDAMCDLLYVIYGTAVSLGIDLEPAFMEVHRSNRSKLHQRPNGAFYCVKNADGKVIKPETYSPPQLESILLKQIK